MVFPSKKDRWITILLWGISIIGLLIPIRTGNLLSVLLILPLIGLLLWFWFRTDYRIIGEKLKIRYGPVRQTIHIKEIQVIFKAKKNPLIAAPALSLDRMVLHCGKFNVTSISPQDKHQFLQALVAINPHIKIERSLKQSLS
ncbi:MULTISPECIES: PH domain-containing protein [Clostridia]|uniref:PH domain-containing protein n=1 Tax=Clostridia TaxID=186801 RepID=UPI000EA1F0DF|nr:MULTISPECIES: PH domain-containing protein [Clostridia]NBJ69936.1 hypothetical protein [Roseburia sp. 1XD42-34]RKI77508.1 hypothetical protein D7V87_10690 [Clostridium sp. 1xD42-85]